MGRSPDFLNVTLLALWEARDVLARGGQRYADNIEKYYKYVRDNDLFLSHALITPQNDRSKQSSEQAHLHMRVVKETDEGIYVSGARMIATLGPVSDEMLMFSLPGLKPGDEDHALMFAVPTGIKGLRQICREPYALSGDRTSFDHPLSSRFEENDSLLIFDNVLVPWDRVFCYRDVQLSNSIYPDTALRNHTAHQTNTRALIKMQFAVGVAIQIARAIKADQFLHVQQMLGECLNSVEILKSGLVRSEVEFEKTAVGTVRTSLAPLQTLRTFLPKAYPKVIETIQTIAAGGFMLKGVGRPGLRTVGSERVIRPKQVNIVLRSMAAPLVWYCTGGTGLWLIRRESPMRKSSSDSQLLFTRCWLTSVRRQGFWDNRRRELTEALVHQVCHLRLSVVRTFGADGCLI